MPLYEKKQESPLCNSVSSVVYILFPVCVFRGKNNKRRPPMPAITKPCITNKFICVFAYFTSSRENISQTSFSIRVNSRNSRTFFSVFSVPLCLCEKLLVQVQEAKLPNQIEQLKARIGYNEDKINEIVYNLYELTDEEIKVVEGK